MIKIFKKNPSDFIAELASSFFKDINYKYLTEGSQAEIFYFSLNGPKTINNIKLVKSEYILKVNNYKLNNEETNYLKKLSDLRLLPKIYYIDNQFTIMKFINGNTLSKVKRSYGLTNLSKFEIYEKIYYLVKKWHNLGIYHGDLTSNNILVTKNDVVFIDPLICDRKECKNKDLNKLEYHRSELLNL